MPNPQLSIMVVDDTKFSSAVIGYTLSQAGYTDIRFASSAMHEERAASVMVADWLMPEMASTMNEQLLPRMITEVRIPQLA